MGTTKETRQARPNQVRANSQNIFPPLLPRTVFDNVDDQRQQPKERKQSSRGPPKTTGRGNYIQGALARIGGVTTQGGTTWGGKKRPPQWSPIIRRKQKGTQCVFEVRVCAKKHPVGAREMDRLTSGRFTTDIQGSLFHNVAQKRRGKERLKVAVRHSSPNSGGGGKLALARHKIRI